LESGKAQESIAALKQYTKQHTSATTVKIVPLAKNNFRRMVAAVAVLLIASLSIYFTIDNQYETKTQADNATPNPKLLESPTGHAFPSETQPNDESEAANKQSLTAENYAGGERIEMEQKIKQEAEPILENTKSLKPIATTDSMTTLARRQDLLRTSEIESSNKDADILEVEKSIEEKKEQITAVVTPPPPPVTQSPSIADDKKEKTGNNSEVLDKAQEKESQKVATDYSQQEKAKKKRAITEESKSSSNTSTGSKTLTFAEEDLKNTLRKQILELASSQKETPKGRFLAKITFTKNGKIRKVVIQEMPCVTCKTEGLIQTIEKSSLKATNEKLIEINF
jgi:hypothetical protein